MTNAKDTWYTAIKEGRAGLHIRGGIPHHCREFTTAAELDAALISGFVRVTRRVSPIGLLNGKAPN
jgi:hypothetical protein